MRQAERRAAEADALRVLGLARRAGRLVTGSEAVRAASLEERAFAIVLARDASRSARQRLRSAVSSTPTYECGTMEELGAAVGTSRSVAVAVTDQGLARRAVAGLKEHRTQGYGGESPVRARA